jgi:hypothetical protein
VSDVNLGFNKSSDIQDIPICFYPIYVLFYLDSNFHERKNFLYMITSETKTDDTNQYKLNKFVELSGITSLPMNKNIKVCAQVYITTLSETGAQCKIDFGNVVIDIVTLLNNKDDTESCEKNYELRLHSVCGNPVKSNIGISGTKVNIVPISYLTNSFVEVKKDSNLYPGTKDVKLFREDLDSWANSKENYYKAMQYMTTYLHHTSEFNKSLTKFMRGKDITCPTNPGQVTLANTDMALPVVSFLYSQKLETTETFFVHQLTMYATRYLVSKKKWVQNNYNYVRDGNYDSIIILKHFESDFFKCNVKERASITMNFLSQYVQMLEYVTDMTIIHNTKKNIEIFGDAITCQCGDCEDFVCSIYQLVTSFQSFNFGTFTKIFDEMKRILSAYVPIATIMGVTTNSIQNAKKSSDNDDNDTISNLEKKKQPPKIISGHAALVMLPLDLFYKYLCRWSHDHKLTLKVYTEMNDSLKKNNDLKNLPVLIGEGTGIFESGVLKDEIKDIRTEFYENCTVIEKVKKLIIPNTRQESPFYSSLIFGFTDKYIEENKIGTLYFSTKHYEDNYVLKNKNNGKTNTTYPHNNKFGRGCTFEDFILDNENITIVPNLCIDSDVSCCEFDPFILNMMQDVSKTRVPLPKLQITHTHTENIKSCIIISKEDGAQSCELDFDTIKCYHTFTNTELTMLLKFLEKINDEPKLKNNKMRQLDSVMCFYILEDYVDETLVESITNFILSSQFDIQGVEIYKEYHTEDFFVYRVDILYCK